MIFVKHFLWVYPAVIMTVWTLLTLLLAWTLPLNKSVPAIISGHALLTLMNPKDDKLYERPSPLLALGFLLAGVIPVVCALMLLFHVVIFCAWAVITLIEFRQNKRT